MTVHDAPTRLDRGDTIGMYATVGIAVIAILAVTAWITFVASAIVWATDTGVSWPVALAAAGVINLVVAAILGFWAKSQVKDMAFAATLRQLRRTAEEAKSEVT